MRSIFSKPIISVAMIVFSAAAAFCVKKVVDAKKRNAKTANADAENVEQADPALEDKKADDAENNADENADTDGE